MASLSDQMVLQTIFNPNDPYGDNLGLEAEVELTDDDSKFDPALVKQAKDLELNGISLTESGNVDAAVEIFSQAIAIIPERASGYNNRAQTLRLKGDTTGAMSDLKKAVELSRGRGRTASLALVQRGILYRLCGQDQEALQDFKQAADLGNGLSPWNITQRDDVMKTGEQPPNMRVAGCDNVVGAFLLLQLETYVRSEIAEPFPLINGRPQPVVTLEENATKEFTCRMDGWKSVPVVTWYLNGKKQPSNQTMLIPDSSETNNQSFSTFVITTHRKDKELNCSATDPVTGRTQNASVILNVQYVKPRPDSAVQSSESTNVKCDDAEIPRENISLQSNLQLHQNQGTNDLNPPSAEANGASKHPSENQAACDEPSDQENFPAVDPRESVRFPMYGYIYKVSSMSSDEIWL
ncbi:hypothetical protein scyTo_0001679 [Scyliorhinus torazame]|uniref:Ig-like domain-containing protein n=1 Tax=Scyliorhinus torazame TaxID=75743 RepID=A0A401PF36_SCYTO|nr:hypothetical protein [Scyliorhinus torazame]